MIRWHRNITAVGLPYHGKVVGSTLHLPNGDTMAHPSAADGAVWVVRNPLAPGAVRNTDQAASDAAAGREWRDYALLSGENRVIGGQALGANAWLYCDGAGTAWVIDSSISGDGSNISVSIVLRSVFGRFHPEPARYAAINRTLFSQSYSYASLGIAGMDLDAGLIGSAATEPSLSGARVAFNIYLTAASSTPDFDVGYGGAQVSLGAVIELGLTGIGSLDAATLGDGIGASHTQTLGRASLRSTVNTPEDEGGQFQQPGLMILVDTITEPVLKTGCTAMDPSGECCTYTKTLEVGGDYNYIQNYVIGGYETHTAKLRAVFNGESLAWFEKTHIETSRYSQNYTGVGTFKEYRERFYIYEGGTTCTLTGDNVIVESNESAHFTTINDGRDTISVSAPGGGSVSKVGGNYQKLVSFYPDSNTPDTLIENINENYSNKRVVMVSPTVFCVSDDATSLVDAIGVDGVAISPPTTNPKLSRQPESGEWAYEETEAVVWV